ncbi:ribokinase [Oscillatoria sp. CS-180]|uniref:ribokinase n=1 Tax=Oscillatoria sp. CS-180 TaxID=3021720 RepID=UPI00232AC0EB|nr:ribokinase [Oscillatoria sp. CS-180]MDB9526204.1 ribokinase [Oscillatoria sp. CS-180]
MTVLVFGSLNMDLVVQSPRLPVPGETLLGNQFNTIPGGKGANQAVAVARQQVPTQMMGRVGADDFGQRLRHALTLDEVAVEGIQVDPNAHTGVAAIVVSDQGENHIIVVPGANSRVDKTDLSKLEVALKQADLLLLQFEIPMAAVIQAAQLAHAAGVTVIVDPAPVQAFDPSELYPYIHVLTPNQVEAAQLVGFPVDTLEQASEAIAQLHDQGAETVLIKMGEQGVLCGTPQEIFHIPAFPITVVDTVAAGDAFNGGLAAALQSGKSLTAAVTWATATAALSVSHAGAQPSLPQRSHVETFLKQQHVL